MPMRTKVAFGAVAMFIAGIHSAAGQVDTSSYQQRRGPSALDQVEQWQRLRIQQQQIEMQHLELERQRWQQQQFFPQMEGEELRRQLAFEREQAELYRKRQLERAKSK